MQCAIRGGKPIFTLRQVSMAKSMSTRWVPTSPKVELARTRMWETGREVVHDGASRQRLHFTGNAGGSRNHGHAERTDVSWHGEHDPGARLSPCRRFGGKQSETRPCRGHWRSRVPVAAGDRLRLPDAGGNICGLDPHDDHILPRWLKPGWSSDCGGQKSSRAP